MSSSRSVAAARSRRADPPQKQNPVTSIGSHASYTGAAARISGAQPPPQYSNQSYQSPPTSYHQSQPPSHQASSNYPPQIPAVEGKITVGNAIALITLRLGRLEEFMNKYHLDLANGVDNSSNGNSINTNSKSSGVDDSVIRNIMTRLEAIESDKLKQQHQIAITKQAPAPAPAQVVVANNDSLVNSLQDEIANVRDELRETKDLLLKLQSFTMETNQKLVDIMFQDMNSIDIQQVDEFEDVNADTGMNESIDVPSINATEEIEIRSDNLNLKDIINKELANVN